MAKLCLNEADVKRLVRLLGMLGSDHIGERAAAALKADEFVRDHGLSWADVIGADITTTASSDHELIAEALADRDLLSEIEVKFLRDAAGFAELSDKQQAWLHRIVDKVRLLREAA
jgi:hypothetical protein